MGGKCFYSENTDSYCPAADNALVCAKMKCPNKADSREVKSGKSE